jgi:hypothetical protein
LSDDAFIWASSNIGGQDAVEEFVSCGVWPLAADVSFEHVKVDLTLVSKLKVPLPRFPLSREDDEDDTHFVVRVEQEARNIVGGYTHMEHKACIASLPNNSRLNCVLEVVGVAYGSHPVPISTEVLKKRKVDATVNVLAKRSKAPEKKGAETAKVSGAHVSGGLKWPSGVAILPAKSMKLSKGTIPTQLPQRPWRELCLKHAAQQICSALRVLKLVGGPQAMKPCPEGRRLFHQPRSTLFWLLGSSYNIFGGGSGIIAA